MNTEVSTTLQYPQSTSYSYTEEQRALQSFFNDSPLMMGIVEITENDILHLHVNPATAKFFGKSTEYLHGKFSSELGVSAERIEKWRRYYLEAMKKNHIIKFRESLKVLESTHWYQVTVSYLGLSSNSNPRFSYILEDITKVVEEENLKLIISKEQGQVEFQLLADAMTQLAWIADKDGFIFWYNKRWYEYTGTTLEEMKGWGWQKVHHPDYAKDVIEFVKSAWKIPEPWELTFPLKRYDGEWRWFLTRATPIKDFSGNIIRWFGTNTDITEQKKLFNELEFEKSRFETVLKQMPSAVIIGEAPTGKLIFANDKMNEVWGHEMYQSENINQYADWIGFHPDGSRYKGEDWPLARSIKTGEIINGEDTDILRGDGKRAIIKLSSAPVRDREGKIVAGVVICTDVTETIQANRSLQESESRLKEAIIARDDFLSIASHELKTPLTSLLLNGQMLKKQIAKNPNDVLLLKKIEKFIEQTNRQTSRLARLVDDMLEISRLRKGKLSIDKDLVNLTEFITDIKYRLDELFIESSGSEIGLLIKDELTGMWNKFRLEQAFTNILTNALKYGNNKPVRILVEKSEDMAIISFIDQGIGIRKEDLEKIFLRFERAGISANEISGLGLGLYISKQIIEAHEGKIEVDSQIGLGSTFKVILPIKQLQRSSVIDMH